MGATGRTNELGDDMKLLALALAAATTVALPGAASAETLFQCNLGNGKAVSVTSEGDRLAYRYGAPRRAELTLAGSARSGNVRFWQERYASILSQVRFTNGAYHYIVYSMGASEVAGSNAVSGIVVMRGTRTIARHACRRHAEFNGGSELLSGLPEDSETYSAMAN